MSAGVAAAAVDVICNAMHGIYMAMYSWTAN